MSNTFKDKLWSEYPIPHEVSIWAEEPEARLDLTEVVNLGDLINSVVEEVASDILVTAYKRSSGLRTKMPDGTVTVQSAFLSQNYMFQGNHLVKVTYDRGANVAYTNYYPCTLTYRRKLLTTDLDALEGDRLRYVKAYTLHRMAAKELQVLKAADFNVDNGQVNLEYLQSFSDEQRELYTTLKEGILLYASVY